MTTYVLLIGLSVAITGYPSLEMCKEAGKAVWSAATYCVPMNANGTVHIGNK